MLEICLSTMHGEIPEWVFLEKKFPVLIINQCDENSEEQLTPKARLVNTTSRGLSVSRNMAIETAREAYIYICDNDNHFYPNALDDLVLLLEIDKPAAAICSSNHIEFAYPSNRKLGLRDIFSVASWQICVRTEVARAVNFDLSFGLGSGHVSHGEENIFLAKIIKRGGRVLGYSVKVVYHPDLGTGYAPNPDFYREKLAIYTEMVGRPLAILLVLRKYIIRRLRRVFT